MGESFFIGCFSVVKIELGVQDFVMKMMGFVYLFWFLVGEESLGPLKHGALSGAAQAPGPANEVPSSTLVLAASRTKRPDILHGFRRYRGGWDFANKHYWAVSKFALLLLWDSVSVLLIVMIKMESCFGETCWVCMA